MQKLLHQRQLLVICGPTATGKTQLGIYLARKFNGEIVSADSRQVYKKMDIGTGKEWGEGVRIWGYDLVDPKREFSVADYMKFADKKINDIFARGKLPILVGGTGLYIKVVIDGIDTASVPRNLKLRRSLERKKVEELFDTLAHLDAGRAGGMNMSDRKNPRRLIRAIEISLSPNLKMAKTKNKKKYATLFIGLTAPKQFLNERVWKRIQKRVEQGIEYEIESILKSGINWNNQSMYSLGYRQFKGYFRGEETFDKAVQDWFVEEKRYAKRQMTWWKHDTRINWFDVNQVNFEKKVESLVKKWYSKSNAKEN